MELAALQAFVEVADRGSFSEAAEALYLTQPAISKRVAQLETELDTRLFDRIGRRIALAPAGAALLPHARRLLNDARELKRLVGDLSGDVSGRLVMGTSHHIGLHRLPGPLKRFTATWPGVELDIRFMDSEAACRAVESGDLELAIVTLPPERPTNLDLETIWDDPLVFVVGPDHPLADRGPVTLSELLKHGAVLPGPTTYTRAILEAAVRDSPDKLRVAMATNYLETLQMLVAAGLGWSLLPATQLDDSVRAIEVGDLRPLRRLGTVTHCKRSLSNAGREMIRMCRESAAT
ncbi:MAG: LysR family transcriptional regulator [Gammaproteobacteria bacterium]|nr:LysR family transcriptional regulator [Gammaproteobacteria bacterium]